jgi:hypothetical protein
MVNELRTNCPAVDTQSPISGLEELFSGILDANNQDSKRLHGEMPPARRRNLSETLLVREENSAMPVIVIPDIIEPTMPLPARNENPFFRKFMSPATLFSHHNKIDWIVQGMIGVQDIGVIFGEPGSGKSFIVLDLLASLAMGCPSWAADHFKTPSARRVLYCAGEGEQGIQKRLYAINDECRRKYSSDIPSDMFTYLPLVPQMFNSGLSENIEAFYSEVHRESSDKLFDLIVIDTLSISTIGARENDNSDMAKVLYNTRQLQQQVNSAIAYVHHAGKNGDYRGASSILGNVDFMVEVKKSASGQGTLRYGKAKDGKPFTDINFQLRHVYSPFDEEGTAVVDWHVPCNIKPVWQRVTDHIEDNPDRSHTVKSLSEETGIPKDQVKNAVRDHIDPKVDQFHCQLQSPDREASSRNPMSYKAKNNSVNTIVRDTITDTSGIPNFPIPEAQYYQG